MRIVYQVLPDKYCAEAGIPDHNRYKFQTTTVQPQTNLDELQSRNPQINIVTELI